MTVQLVRAPAGCAVPRPQTGERAGPPVPRRRGGHHNESAVHGLPGDRKRVRDVDVRLGRPAAGRRHDGPALSPVGVAGLRGDRPAARDGPPPETGSGVAAGAYARGLGEQRRQDPTDYGNSAARAGREATGLGRYLPRAGRGTARHGAETPPLHRLFERCERGPDGVRPHHQHRRDVRTVRSGVGGPSDGDESFHRPVALQSLTAAAAGTSNVDWHRRSWKGGCTTPG
mmetsp:Transcript_8767/g.17977  ORF Transcript_8767/g.17977 Transcript_8767/m.17977 type:complete len:229 (-) Transcript_8767:1723-2409(-)